MGPGVRNAEQVDARSFGDSAELMIDEMRKQDAFSVLKQSVPVCMCGVQRYPTPEGNTASTKGG